MDVFFRKWIQYPLIDKWRKLQITAPKKPHPDVQEMLSRMQLKPKHLSEMYVTFHNLKQAEFGYDKTIRTASVVGIDALVGLVTERREWVETCLKRLAGIAGCHDGMGWDEFLFTFLKFCSLSKVELCQCLYFIIMRDVESEREHFLTWEQLGQYFSLYKECPIKTFCTRDIKFDRLPLERYYISDFVELCHKYSVLLNPLNHLQRSLQQRIPSTGFWNNYDRSETFNRIINSEFFRISRSHIYLRGEPAFKERSDFLIPDTLGGEVTNKSQWSRRLNHYDHKLGVWPDFGEMANRAAKIGGKAEDFRRLLPSGEVDDEADHRNVQCVPTEVGVVPQRRQGEGANSDGLIHPPETIGLPLPGEAPIMSKEQQAFGGGAAGGPPGAAMPGSMNAPADPMMMPFGTATGGAAPVDVFASPADSLYSGASAGHPQSSPADGSNSSHNNNAINGSGSADAMGGGGAGGIMTGPRHTWDQSSARAPGKVTHIRHMPDWMNNYIDVDMKKSDVQRIQEMEFIRSMRMTENRQDSIMNAQSRTGTVPLVPRPGAHFLLQGMKPAEPVPEE